MKQGTRQVFLPSVISLLRGEKKQQHKHMEAVKNVFTAEANLGRTTWQRKDSRSKCKAERNVPVPKEYRLLSSQKYSCTIVK